MTTITDQLRSAKLATLAQTLNSQRTRALDVVVPASALRSDGGAFILRGTEPVLTDDGVDQVDGRYVPTGVALEGVASKLDIPIKYLRRMHEHRLDLFDENVNGWLRDDPRRFLCRMLRRPDGGVDESDGSHGAMRAFLSDSYRVIDNYDVLLAVLNGIKQAGVDNPTIEADLTDRRMYLRVQSTGIAAMAPELLKGYRSPFGGHDVGDGWTPDRVARAAGGEGQAYAPGSEPIVFAGFIVTNSETGGGAFTITPRLVVQVCKNGLTITADAKREVHLGARQDEGLIKWSEETARANLALVASQTTDAVRTFLDVSYVEAKVAELEKLSGAPVAKPQEVITTVSKKLGFTEAQAEGILGHFIQGGQLTAGGVMQAVTSMAQTMPDGDAAYDMESKAMASLELAARA